MICLRMDCFHLNLNLQITYEFGCFGYKSSHVDHIRTMEIMSTHKWKSGAESPWRLYHSDSKFQCSKVQNIQSTINLRNQGRSLWNCWIREHMGVRVFSCSGSSQFWSTSMFFGPNTVAYSDLKWAMVHCMFKKSLSTHCAISAGVTHQSKLHKKAQQANKEHL